MTNQIERICNYINEFQFAALCNELGWNHCDYEAKIQLEGQTYSFRAIAEKCRFVIFHYQLSQRPLPFKAVDLLSQVHQENLVIGSTKNGQIWMWVHRQPKRKPVYYQLIHIPSENTAEFAEKLLHLSFDLREEDTVTLIDVVKRVYALFSKNSDKAIGKVDNPRPRIKLSTEIETDDPNLILRIDLMEGGGIDQFEAVYGVKFRRLNRKGMTPMNILIGIGREEKDRGLFYMMNMAGNPKQFEDYEINLARDVLKIVRGPDFRWGVKLTKKRNAKPSS